jgi:hypothetical protein
LESHTGCAAAHKRSRHPLLMASSGQGIRFLSEIMRHLERGCSVRSGRAQDIANAADRSGIRRGLGTARRE